MSKSTKISWKLLSVLAALTLLFATVGSVAAATPAPVALNVPSIATNAPTNLTGGGGCYGDCGRPKFEKRFITDCVGRDLYGFLQIRFKKYGEWTDWKTVKSWLKEEHADECRNHHDGGQPEEPAPVCSIDVQAYAAPSNLRGYLAIAWSGKSPDQVTDADEGEIMDPYVVNNGDSEVIQPAGHADPFLAFVLNGQSVDGNAHVPKDYGTVMLNYYNENGLYQGHLPLRWNGERGKGFNCGDVTFLDLGVLP